MLFGRLDRYVLREWTRIFVITTIGFPFIAILFEVVDSLSEHLSRVPPRQLAVAYLAGMPEQIFRVIPAAVLFSTVFTIGTLGRHSELTAMKASGRSFHRVVAPILFVALLASGLALAVGELAPPSSRLKAELLSEDNRRAQLTRFNFVYRADQGWVYMIRSLDVNRLRIAEPVFQREGTGLDYPTLVIQSRQAAFDSTSGRWAHVDGRYRVVAGPDQLTSFEFDSLVSRAFVERPEDLLAEPKAPEEMRYEELGAYIDALERSGGDVRKIRVQQELKIAVPFTCLVIAIFGAPMALTSPRAGNAFGIAVSLGTTVIFLILVQLSQAIGAGGLLPPRLAAWGPNLLFGTAGLILLARARS